jgi:hypothetical protein
MTEGWDSIEIVALPFGCYRRRDPLHTAKRFSPMLVIGGLTHDKLLIMRASSTPKRGKSASDNRKPIRSPLRPDEFASVTDGYRLWLARQPLSVNTRRTYLGRVRQYCAYLETSTNDYGDPLSDPHARDYAIRDFKSHPQKGAQGQARLG